MKKFRGADPDVARAFTIELALPASISHAEAQARILRVVGEEFRDVRGSPLTVRGAKGRI